MLLLFWQISALDLESINVKFNFTNSMCLTSFVVVFLLVMIFVIDGVSFLTTLQRRVQDYIHIHRGPNKVGFVGLF